MLHQVGCSRNRPSNVAGIHLHHVSTRRRLLALAMAGRFLAAMLLAVRIARLVIAAIALPVVTAVTLLAIASLIIANLAVTLAIARAVPTLTTALATMAAA